MNRKKVFVGMSGGVDSSVAALRLLRAGYNVVGVFIKVWHPEWLECNWEQERLDAMRVAAHLGIPFLTCDAEAAYKQDVADYFIAEYAAGRTPNPDVMCNQHVKFGRFLEFARERGADYIATGHYARVDCGGEQCRLLRGVDSDKDQSYFLWSLTEEQLAHTLLPIGDTKKADIRHEAAAAGLPTATKKDSQGICFLGHVDIPEFLSHYVTLTPGPVLNEAGEEIGEHQGALVYTLGQRHGFTLKHNDTNQTRLYVVAKDVEQNTITVAAKPPRVVAGEQMILRDSVVRGTLTPGDELTVQTRYRQPPIAVRVDAVTAEQLQLTFTAATETPASGQSCVLYRGEECVSGGIIE